MKNRIKEELTIIGEEITKLQKEAPFHASHTEVYQILIKDLFRKLDAKTSKSIQETYMKIERLRHSYPSPSIQERYKDAIESINKTLDLLK